jgi:hypothetical protein
MWLQARFSTIDFQLVLMGRVKSKLKLWLQGLKMGELQTISSSVFKNLGWSRDFNPFNYVVKFVRDCSSLTSNNHDQVGFGGRGLGGGGGTFHGCVTDPRLMMIPKGIYFGL